MVIIEKIAIAAAIIVSYALQTSIDFLVLGHIKPDFLLILTVYVSLKKGRLTGLWVGFFSGLLQDINLGGVALSASEELNYYIGTHTLPKTLIGYFNNFFFRMYPKEILIFLIMFSLSFIKGFLTFLILLVFQTSVSAGSILTIILPESLYTSLLSVFWLKLLDSILPFRNTSTSNA